LGVEDASSTRENQLVRKDLLYVNEMPRGKLEKKDTFEHAGQRKIYFELMTKFDGHSKKKKWTAGGGTGETMRHGGQQKGARGR